MIFVRKELFLGFVKMPKNRAFLTILDNIEITGGKLIKYIGKTYEKSLWILAVCYNVVGKIYKGEILTVWVIGLPSSPNSYITKR